MTTYFPFTPSQVAVPTFQPTLDNNVYVVTVTWNLFGQRYYVNCYDQSNDLIFSVALVETAPGLAIQSLAWNGETLQTILTTVAPHNFLKLTVENAVPAAYNGTYLMFVTGPSTLAYNQAAYPGALVTPGDLAYLVSMCAGYFNSTLVFRNNQFEVSP